MNWKHVSKKAVKWSAIAIGALVLCLALLFALLQTESGRKSLVNMAAGILAEGDRKVEIGTVTGLVPFHFQLESMSVADEKGPLFRLGALEIEWSPWSMLKGDIHVRTLKCGFFHLDRLPEQREKKAGSLRLPRWLAFFERLRIDHLAIAELVAGQSILGERAAFRLEADLKAALPGGEWITRLALDRTDGPEARLLLEGTIKENGRFLILKVDAREAEKGLLSTGAGIKGPIELAIQGEGPRSEWKGRMEMKAGGAGSLNGRILASYEGGLNLDMEGVAEPEPGFLSDFLGDVPDGRIRFSLKGTLGDDRQLRIEHLSLESGEANLLLSGSSNLREGTLNAHLQARHNEIKKLEKGFQIPLGGRVALDGAISGTFFRPSAVLRLESGDLMVERIRVSELAGEIHADVADAVNGSPPALRFKGSGLLKGLSLRDMDPLPEKDLQWSFSGEKSPSSRLLVKSMVLKGEKNSVQLSGEIHPSTGEGKLEAEVETKDLRSLSKGLGMELPGSGRLKAALDGDFKGLSLSGVLQGKLELKSEVSKGKAALFLHPISREGLDFRAKISLDQGRRLVVSDLRLANPALVLSGGGTLDLHKRQGASNVHIQMHDLQPWSSAAGIPLSGSLQANAALDGSQDKLTLRTEIQGEEVQAGKVHLGRIRIGLNGSGKTRANDGSFRFEAGEERGGISGEGLFSTRGEGLSLRKVLLSGPGNTRAKGNLDFDLGTKLVEGSVSGECPDLAPFSGFLNQTLKGRVKFSAEMGKSRKVQQLKLAFSGTNLKADPLEAGEIRLEALLTELSDNPRGTANAECRDVRMPGIHVSSLSLKARGDGSEVSFDADAKGALDRKFDLESKGLYRSLKAGSNLTIKRFQGMYGELPFRIPEPFSMERSGAGISAEAIRLILGGGGLSGGGRLGSGGIDASFKFENLPVNLIRPADFPIVEGSGSGEVVLRGKLERPEGMTRIRIAGLRGHNPKLKGIPPAVLEAQVDLRGQRLKGQLSLHGVTEKPFTAIMDVPLQLSLAPFHVSFPGAQNIAGDLNGKADLTRLGGFLGLYDQEMSGIAEVALHLEGTPDHPLITGTIGVENGGYENARSGTLLKDVNVLLIAGTKGLVIERARASDGEEGTALAEGWLEVDPRRGFPFQVDLMFQKSKMVRHDWVTAKGKGQVQLKGSFSHAVLSGEVQVESGEFRIPERMAPDMPRLDVIELNGPRAATKVIPEQAKKSNPYLDFDLRVKAPGRFFVRGRGLESEWKGELRLAGPVNQPLLTGELSVERGRFTFLDRRFTLTDGKITFNGLAHPSPFLDVLATSSAKDITAQLHLIGPVRSPEIKLSSEPPLPSDEVLSRLLFGQSMNRITPLQAIQLAQTLNMMGGRQTLDLMSATRKLLRIDQLEVKQSGENNNETSISAGKYLRDHVYLEVEKSLGPGGAKASVEWEFSPHLSVETEIGTDAGSGVGVNWKWDY